MSQAITLYKQLKKYEKKYETAGPVERKRIMKKVLRIKEKFDRVMPAKDTPTFQNAGIDEDGQIVHNVHPDVKD